MSELGKVGDWNEARGFGFIQPLDAAQPRLFFHIRDYRQDGRRPELGEMVKFQRRQQNDGRWSAAQVARVTPPRKPTRTPPRTGQRDDPGIASSSWWPGALLLAAYMFVLGWGTHSHRVPALLIYVLLGMCAITFIAYALDKRAAGRGQWRTPESTLQLMALAGGWPGAWLAQRLLRHKSRKASFQNLFWVCVVANSVLTALWVLRQP